MTAVLPRRRFGGLAPKLHDPNAHKRTQETQVMLEEAAWLRSFGTSWEKIAERLGVQEASLRKAVATAAEQGFVIE